MFTYRGIRGNLFQTINNYFVFRKLDKQSTLILDWMDVV